MEFRTAAVFHRVAVVLLVCSSLVAIVYTEGCTDPFELIGESCLYLHVVNPYEFIYSDAVDICENLGGSVVVINTQQEFDDVLALMVAQGEREFVVWVGCRSPPGSQEFQCIDESVYYRGALDFGGYWKWRLGFPNPAAVTSTCVLFFQDKKNVADSSEFDDDCELILSPVMCEEGTPTNGKLSTTVAAKTSAAVTTSSAAVKTSSAAVTTSSAAVTTSSAAVKTSSAAVKTSTAAATKSSAAVKTSSAAVTTSSAAVKTSSAAVTTFSTTMDLRTSTTKVLPDKPQRTCFLYGKSTAKPTRFTSSLMWHLKDDACAHDHVMRKISNAPNVVVCASVCGTYENCQFINYYPKEAICEFIDDTQ